MLELTYCPRCLRRTLVDNVCTWCHSEHSAVCAKCEYGYTVSGLWHCRANRCSASQIEYGSCPQLKLK